MEQVVAVPLELHVAALSESQKTCKNVNGFTSYAGLSGREGKLLVCVTGGNSYLGSHIVKELLAHSYLVRVIIQNQGRVTLLLWGIYHKEETCLWK